MRAETSPALFATSPEPDGLELAFTGAACSQSVARAREQDHRAEESGWASVPHGSVPSSSSSGGT